MTTTAERLKEAMLHMNMKASELSEKTGIGKSSISHYVNGTVKPKQDRIFLMAQALNVDEVWLMGHDVPMARRNQHPPPPSSTPVLLPIDLPPASRIPILGTIIAGEPMFIEENIDGYIDFDKRKADTGEYFALRIVGDSMSPKLEEGDIVIVHSQSYIDSGDIAVVNINGESATVKKVKKSKEGITLIGFNVEVYEPHTYTNKDIIELPIIIQGKVVEVRRRL